MNALDNGDNTQCRRLKRKEMKEWVDSFSDEANTLHWNVVQPYDCFIGRLIASREPRDEADPSNKENYNPCLLLEAEPVWMTGEWGDEGFGYRIRLYGLRDGETYSFTEWQNAMHEDWVLVEDAC